MHRIDSAVDAVVMMTAQSLHSKLRSPLTCVSVYRPDLLFKAASHSLYWRAFGLHSRGTAHRALAARMPMLLVLVPL